MPDLIGVLSASPTLSGKLTGDSVVSGGLSLATIGTLMWFGTRDEYNSLEIISPDVCYCIEEGT